MFFSSLFLYMFSPSSDINPCHSLFFDLWYRYEQLTGDHFGVGIILESIWGSFWGRDHFGGCTDARNTDWLIFDNSLSLASAGFLGGVIQNSKRCRQALLSLLLSYGRILTEVKILPYRPT